MHPLMEPEAEIRDDHAKFFFIGSAVNLAPSMSAPCDFGYGRRQLSSCLSEGITQASFYRAPSIRRTRSTKAQLARCAHWMFPGLPCNFRYRAHIWMSGSH